MWGSRRRADIRSVLQYQGSDTKSKESNSQCHTTGMSDAVTLNRRVRRMTTIDAGMYQPAWLGDFLCGTMRMIKTAFRIAVRDGHPERDGDVIRLSNGTHGAGHDDDGCEWFVSLHGTDGGHVLCGVHGAVVDIRSVRNIRGVTRARTAMPMSRRA